MPSPQEREAALFALAVEKPVAERAAFLHAVCGGDAALRQRLDALLAAHEQPDPALAAVTVEARPTIKLDLAEAPDEAVGQTLGRYKLLERVGEGGCGVVYVAEQTEPVRRRVALKVIKLGMDTKQVVARFEAERQALAMMDHPNIAKVLDAGMTEGSAGWQPAVSPTGSRPGVASSSAPAPPDPPQAGSPAIQQTDSLRYAAGRPYFVMELVRGIPITQYCDQEKVSTRERLDLFIKVCHAIQHAHQKGIIHRDIKPSNILVTLHDGVPVPKVIDFGIAKATEGRLTDSTVYTQLHQFIGTPAYMSPEQAEMSGLDIDTRSDIYSLGVLLYELLTGSTPFDPKELLSGGIDAMRKTIREKEPVRPSTRLSQTLATTPANSAKHSALRASHAAIESDLDWIVMKCLEKDRSRRYDTANGLAADLKRHLNNEPVVARPPSAAYRLQKTWRRHRVLMTAGFLVAFSLSFGIGFSLNQARRARSAEQSKQVLLESERKARMEATTASALATAKAGELSTNLYFNHIALAHRESTAQPANVKRAEQLLNECPENLRNWEWHYLKRRRYQVPVELREFGDQKVHCVAFSANGRLLAAGGGDGKVRIWDVTGPTLLRTLTNHTGYVASVAFSPANPDWIASAGADNRLRLWDWREAREVRSWASSIGKDYGLAHAVAFSPDGRRLAAPGTAERGEAIVHDVESGGTAFKLGAHEEGALFSLQPGWSLARDRQRAGRGQPLECRNRREGAAVVRQGSANWGTGFRQPPAAGRGHTLQRPAPNLGSGEPPGGEFPLDLDSRGPADGGSGRASLGNPAGHGGTCPAGDPLGSVHGAASARLPGIKKRMLQPGVLTRWQPPRGSQS
jgi:eukaryotic-like serine/threonine-protein kinase